MHKLLVGAASAFLLSASAAIADPVAPPREMPVATDSAALAPGSAAGEHEASLISAPGWTAIAAVAIVAVIAVAVTASENNTSVKTH